MIEGGSFVIMLISAVVAALLIKHLAIPYVTALAFVGAAGGALIGNYRLLLDQLVDSLCPGPWPSVRSRFQPRL